MYISLAFSRGPEIFSAFKTSLSMNYFPYTLLVMLSRFSLKISFFFLIFIKPRISDTSASKTAISETGAASKAEMGKVMAVIMPKVKGKAEGSLVYIFKLWFF